MKIMIVDDEAYALKELSKCIHEIQPDAEVFSFEYSDEALSFGQTEKALDVAFLDVNMPHINGIDLAKELKKDHPSLNVIFCTAYEKYTMDAIGLHASGYVNKPYNKEDIVRELNNLLYPVSSGPKVFIRTFGDFDIFVDGRVINNFKRSKSKELLAYLVAKRGGIASRQELIAVLFGDKDTDSTKDYFKKVFYDLTQTLQGYGIENIIVKGYNQYAVDTKMFSCDLYDYEKGSPEALKAYEGEFMAQYDWAEM